MKPTAEQQHCADRFEAGETLAIEALAGSGKTTTLKLLTQRSRPGDRVLYTAFSNRVVADAKAAFPSSVAVRTNHSLAMSVGRHYQDAKRLDRRPTPRIIAQALGWTQRTFGPRVDAETGAYLALEAVLRFQQSAAPELTAHFVRVPADRTHGAELAGTVLAAARRLWAEFTDLRSELPVTHDTYLKVWALSQPKLPYDVVLLDEAQDANALIVDLLGTQRAQKVIVGDRYQQIYSWRGAVSAMQSFPVDTRCWLTQSFRFGHAVADAGNRVLDGHLFSDIRVRGNPALASTLAPANGSVILARTNSTLICDVVAAQTQGIGKIAVVGGVTDLLRLVKGAACLQRGERAVKTPDLMDFADWDEVTAYADSDAGRDLGVLCQLVEQYGTEQLADILNKVKGNELDEASCDRLLSTAHKSKGREWDQVILRDDFRVPNDADLGLDEDPRARRSPWTTEDAHLLYVAVTRAKQVLDVANCGAWIDARERSDARARIARPAAIAQSTQSPPAPAAAPSLNSLGDGSPEAMNVAFNVLHQLAQYAVLTPEGDLILRHQDTPRGVIPARLLGAAQRLTAHAGDPETPAPLRPTAAAPAAMR